MIVLTTKNSFFLKGKLKVGCSHAAPLNRMISRLNYKPEGLRFTLASEEVSDIITQPSNTMTFEELCYQRAVQIENSSFEKIYLSYSGGIDSSLVLVSFLKYWQPATLRKLTVLMNVESINENPVFFNQFLGRVSIETIFKSPSQWLHDDMSCYITGEHGDQLYGSDMIGRAVIMYGDSIIHKPYADAVLKLMQYFPQDDGVGKKVFERLQPIIEESPFPIKTVHDFLWWYNFTQKWQYVKYRFLADRLWQDPQNTAKRVFHFYDTPQFQKWSLLNHDKKIKNTWNSYKYPMKELIFEYVKDSAYLKKEKVASLPQTQALLEFNDGFDSNFRPLSKEQILSHVI